MQVITETSRIIKDFSLVDLSFLIPAVKLFTSLEQFWCLFTYQVGRLGGKIYFPAECPLLR